MLDAKVILNNFLGSPRFRENIKEETVNRKIIDQCSVFISNNLPGYVVCDLSDESIEKAMSDGDFEYDFAKKNFVVKNNIDREEYNLFYPPQIVHQLEDTIDCFLERGVYKNYIAPIKTLVG